MAEKLALIKELEDMGITFKTARYAGAAKSKGAEGDISKEFKVTQVTIAESPLLEKAVNDALYRGEYLKALGAARREANPPAEGGKEPRKGRSLTPLTE